jgi:HK97 family phage major capsid protein
MTDKSKLRGIGLQFFGVPNLDAKAENRQKILQKMTDAVKANDGAGDPEAFSAAFEDLANDIQSNLQDQFKELTAQNDKSALAARGVRILTSQETKYYEAIIGAMKNAEPKSALAGVNVVLPDTVINSVFDDIQKDHPLLAAINFQNTAGLVKMLLSTNGGVASWGALGDKVSSELSASFTEIDLLAGQLTAYIPVAKYMLELGPAWMDTYVRTLLSEAMATQLEAGIVDGNGKNQPIGMDRKLTGAVDGVYGMKAATKITDLSPTTFGMILDDLSTDKNGNKRPVTSIIMVVNPSDYFTKVFPATTPHTTDGGYNHDVFPFPTTCIPSAAVPAGNAIFGIAQKYFMGCGIGTQGGKLEYSDDVNFLDRQRVYLTYLYGNGRALDEHAFYLADITGLKPYVKQVEVVNTVTTKASA